MPYPLPLTRTEAYLAYKAGVVQLSDLKPSLAKPRIGIDDWLAYWTGLKNDYPKNPDGTPKMLQEEEKYIAYLSGVTNTYPEKCLRRVGAYLRYIISARWGRPDRPLNREELYLSLIKTQFIPSGDPSSDITIDGTAKAPFVDVKMYGDTFQQTYTGKNLLGLKNPSSNTFGFEPVVAEESGTITVNGTFTGGGGGFPWISDRQLSIPAGTYTFSMKNPQSFNVSLRMFDAQGQYTSGKYIAAGATSGTFTLEYDCVRVAILIGAFSAGKTLNNQKFEELQLEAGSTATSFEPFVGGQPSPSPDYPQQIQTVTGEQTVTVTGKNLLNYNTIMQTTLNGVTLSLADDGTITLNGTCSSDNTRFAFDGLSLALDGTYTLSSEVISGTITNATDMTKIRLFKSGYSGGIRVDLANTSASSTSSASGDYILNDIRIDNGVVLTNYKIKIQLEKSATATSFEPYAKHDYHISLGDIELCKLGTYQDYIWKDGDDWKVHKATGKKVLNGSEGYARFVSNNIVRFITYIDGSINTTTRSDLFRATHFHYLGTGDEVGGAILNASNIGLMFGANDESLDQFKEWLRSNNVTLDFVLATPTDTTITDQTLIAQLDSLVNGGAEDGTTYIKVNATDPNLPGLLYVEAPKYE